MVREDPDLRPATIGGRKIWYGYTEPVPWEPLRRPAFCNRCSHYQVLVVCKASDKDHWAGTMPFIKINNTQKDGHAANCGCAADPINNYIDNNRVDIYQQRAYYVCPGNQARPVDPTLKLVERENCAQCRAIAKAGKQDKKRPAEGGDDDDDGGKKKRGTGKKMSDQEWEKRYGRKPGQPFDAVEDVTKPKRSRRNVK